MSSLVAKLQSIETSEFLPSFGSGTASLSNNSGPQQSDLVHTTRIEETPEPTTREFDDDISAVSDGVSESGLSTNSFPYDYSPITRRQEIALEREARLKAEHDNLRFQPQLIARKSVTSYSDALPGETRVNRFELLYNEARQRQVNDKARVSADKSTFIPKITPRAKSRERSESPQDRSERLYSGIGSGRRNPELENSSLEQPSFRPKITKRAKSLERNGDSLPLNERLYQRAQLLQEKQEQLKVSQDRRREEECTFTPKINDRKSPLREQEYRSPIEISDRMQRYLQERDRRLQEAQKAKEEQEAISSPFRPQLMAKKKVSGNRTDVDLVDVFTRLSSADRDVPAAATRNGDKEFSFKPQIHTRRRSVTPTSPAAPGVVSETSSTSSPSVYDRLYEKGEQRRRELEINRQLKRQVEDVNLTFTPQLRSTTPVRSRSPELAASERSLAMDRLTAGKQYVQDILSRLKTEYELRDCTFTPEINSVSRQKAEASPRTSTPVHERLKAQADKTKEKVKKLEEELIRKELEDCTFSPHLPKSSVVVENRGSDVFVRLIQDEKEKEAQMKKRADDLFVHELNGCTFNPSVPHNIEVKADGDVFERLSKSPQRVGSLSRSSSHSRLTSLNLQSDAVSSFSDKSSVSSRPSHTSSSTPVASHRTATPSKKTVPAATPSSAGTGHRTATPTGRQRRLSSSSAVSASMAEATLPAAKPTSSRASSRSKDSTAATTGGVSHRSSSPAVTPRSKASVSNRPVGPSVNSQKDVKDAGVAAKRRAQSPSVSTRTASPAASRRLSDFEELQLVFEKSAVGLGAGSLSLLDAVHSASEQGVDASFEPSSATLFSISSMMPKVSSTGGASSDGSKLSAISNTIDGETFVADDDSFLLAGLDGIPHATPAFVLRKDVILPDDPIEPTIIAAPL